MSFVLPRGLYAITPDEPQRAELLAKVNAVLAGGCRLLQYRDKLSNKAEQLARAHALRTLTAEYNATLVINDDLALAAVVGADAVHLGQEDGSWRGARAILSPGKGLGASCYADLALAEQAVKAGVDYVAFGAFFPSPTKPKAVRATVDLIVQAKTRWSVPVCAIGGITLAQAPALVAAGADCLAVISDLFCADDIADQAAAYQSLFQEQTA